jgi:prepilin-type N-terminal cleavage/methylation domain-containing protein
LLDFEDTLEALFTRWSLWSRNRNDQPQGVISHNSALMHYGIIDEDMSKPVHLTVPKGFQKRNIPTDALILHKDNLPLSDLENHGSFMTKKLFRTLQDTKEELENQGKWNEVADRATKSGKLTESELLKLGIITTDSKMLDNTGNNLGGGLYLGGNGQVQNNEVYYRAQEAKKIFESMERQGRWAMSASNFRNGRSTQSGFTLVELLVVIAIISILAGMLLPVLGNAVSAARQIQCINNQKQYGFVFSIYLNDHDQYYPPNRASQTTYPEYNGQHIQTYLSDNGYAEGSTPCTGSGGSVGKAGIFMCPEDKDREALDRFGYSYGYNHYIGAYYTSTTSGDSYLFYRFTMTLNVCKNPGKVLLFADSQNNNNWTTRFLGTMYPFDISKPSSNGYNYIPMWHNNNAVVSFLDNHVSSMTDIEIFDTNNELSMFNGGYW